MFSCYFLRKFHYLSGGAILINNNGVETLYYGYADNQGSLVALTNENGTVVEKYAYDPWGVRRNPDDWLQTDSRTSLLTNRGYTGHEHLDMFGIINMNGRVYDPATAMFFSPDPFVQSPGNWLNYNRYAYVMHNPLKFTDPSGYYPKELGNHPSPVTSDYNHDYTYGLGGGGFGQAEPNPFSFNTWWNAYIFASRKGYNGGLSNFQQQYFNPDAWNNDKLTLENHYWTQNSETRNSEFYKVSTKHTTFVTISLNEKKNEYSYSRNDFSDFANKANIASGIVGTIADILSAAGINVTLGIWKDLSKFKLYVSGWSGGNQYVWKTFGIAKSIGFGATGVGVLSEVYLSSSIDPQTGNPYQSWAETGFNATVTGASMWIGGFWGIAIQFDYSMAKIYFKTLKDHPDWATYKYHPH